MWRQIMNQRHALTFGFLLMILCLLNDNFINCQLMPPKVRPQDVFNRKNSIYPSTEQSGSSSIVSSSSSTSGSSPSSSTGIATGSSSSVTPGKTHSDQDEPTCEALRAMWRYSKRQSRKSEITNELPTYRDPYRYNFWEPYYGTSRSMAGLKIGAGKPKSRGRLPVYGKIVHTEPITDFQDRIKVYDEMGKYYTPDNSNTATTSSSSGNIAGLNAIASSRSGSGSPSSPSSPMAKHLNQNVAAAARRRQQQQQQQFRFNNGKILNSPGANALVPQKGSFQRLKELIQTERARELAQQRKLEESAARAAALKEISKGAGYVPHYRVQSQSIFDDDQSKFYRNGYGYDAPMLRTGRNSPGHNLAEHTTIMFNGKPYYIGSPRRIVPRSTNNDFVNDQPQHEHEQPQQEEFIPVIKRLSSAVNMNNLSPFDNDYYTIGDVSPAQQYPSNILNIDDNIRGSDDPDSYIQATSAINYLLKTLPNMSRRYLNGRLPSRDMLVENQQQNPSLHTSSLSSILSAIAATDAENYDNDDIDGNGNNNNIYNNNNNNNNRRDINSDKWDTTNQLDFNVGVGVAVDAGGERVLIE